jgi:hypothetical protein
MSAELLGVVPSRTRNSRRSRSVFSRVSPAAEKVCRPSPQSGGSMGITSDEDTISTARSSSDKATKIWGSMEGLDSKESESSDLNLTKKIRKDSFGLVVQNPKAAVKRHSIHVPSIGTKSQGDQAEETDEQAVQKNLQNLQRIQKEQESSRFKFLKFLQKKSKNNERA